MLEERCEGQGLWGLERSELLQEQELRPEREEGLLSRIHGRRGEWKTSESGFWLSTLVPLKKAVWRRMRVSGLRRRMGEAEAREAGAWAAGAFYLFCVQMEMPCR